MRSKIRTLKERISVTIDSDIIAELRILSENDDRSFSQYINMVLKDHVSKLTETPSDK